MSRIVLTGVSGANPLGFMASLGLLRIASVEWPTARLGFLDDASFCPFIEGVQKPLEDLVAADAAAASTAHTWRLHYEKQEKNGAKSVADLKPPPAVFEKFVADAIEEWRKGRPEAADYAAAYATSVAKDGKGNTKPTAFHFTAANQQFLGAIETIRGTVDAEWAHQSLFNGDALRPGGNVRWNPAADRNYALMAADPVSEGTSVDAPLEWLAFRSLPLLPTVPIRDRVWTTCVSGRGDEMQMRWPLWTPPAGINAARSLIELPANERSGRGLFARGVFAICAADIRRSTQGFGNFGPASINRVRT